MADNITKKGFDEFDRGTIENIAEYLSPEELYSDVIERVRRYHPSDDISLIEKGYAVAKKAHEGQKRKSGEPYIIHPLCVAIILAELEMDKETIVAGLLHDVVEDTAMTKEDVAREFSDEVALLVDGVARAVMPSGMHDDLSYGVLIFAITLSGWVRYARTVRGSTLVEKEKEYVLAARVIGTGREAIVFKHILPNVLGPVFVLATVHVATAIMTEATLSFLGVGVPPTTPSLGTLIRIGNDYLFSGEWWVTVFPGLVLVLLVLSVNLLGDWLRDALNPKLQ